MDDTASRRPTTFSFSSDNIVKFLKGEQVNPTCELHKHQVEAVLKAKHYLDVNPGDPAIVVLPTGCGKTGVAVLASYAVNVRKVLVITPSVKISEQIQEAFVGGINDQPPCFLFEYGITEDPDKKPSYEMPRKVNEIGRNVHDLLIVNAHKLDWETLKNIPKDNYDLVIVDEAHHYPADTWRIPTDYFRKSKRLFLTATPFHQGKRVLTKNHICYEMTKEDAITNGIIRNLRFVEVSSHYHDGKYIESEVYEKISERIFETLCDHDRADSKIKHQAMVLVTTKQEADEFRDKYNETNGEGTSATYYGGTNRLILKNFISQELRTLVVVGRLIEGFDQKSISVVAIARNVQKQSRVLFTQFVGRAVRKAHLQENIDAVLISHLKYKQKPNYDQFYEIVDEEIGEDIED